MIRIVLHIDMDAFFASVEERDKPRLRGLPIVVGADPAEGRGRGVVSTANYVARKYGIKSAMPISRAWDKSQQAKKAGKAEVVFMEPDFKAYSKASQAVFGYISKQGDAFESGGIDEGYLEVRGANQESSEQFWERAKSIAQRIKDWVTKEQGLTCSIGIGPNKLIAKIAAGRQKPDGLTIVTEEQVQKFLDPLSVRELMGVGPKTESALNKSGIKTIKDLRERSRAELVEAFGKHGQGLYRQARGIDDSPLEAFREQKSIGEQITFEKDTLNSDLIFDVFLEMVDEVAQKIKKENKKYKTVAMIIRFSDFETLTRSHTLKEATDDAQTFKAVAATLLLPFLDSRGNPKRKKIRLIGVRAERLFEKGLF